jgi:hypothetical protein
MSRTAIATLQTPWDCRWSRFGRTRSTGSNTGAEGLWVCVYGDGARRPIRDSDCETCPNWEYAPPLERSTSGSSAQALVQSRSIVGCLHENRTRKRLEIGTRVAALALAAIFAGTGFVVLTRPLAIPLTISLWMGAVTSFGLGVWGRFDRESQ